MLYPSVCIGDPVPAGPENRYFVEVYIEHGDADFRETNGQSYKVDHTMHKMLEDLAILKLVADYTYNNQDFDECVEFVCEKLNITDKKKQDYVHDLLIDFPGYDKKYEGSGSMACLVGIEVYYYNDLGVKYNCTINWNDLK